MLAGERTVRLYGQVLDSFTRMGIPAHVTLMNAADSTVVDTLTAWNWRDHSGFDMLVPAVPAKFVFKAVADGYEDAFLNYELKRIARNTYFELPPILMKKKLEPDTIPTSPYTQGTPEDSIWKSLNLKGVTVTGTRVKMVWKGDTIVYNAAAFKLPEGSMLDALVKQLPGAELKDNGDIYVNGKKVDYLTLNGEDFFKGNNKVMLDNLPYYTVKNIQVYHKSSEKSRWAEQELEEKDFVMDVQLKREYSTGYMGNVEAGGGLSLTDNERAGRQGNGRTPYMGRFFAVRFTDHSRLSLFGNVNNVNEDRKPGYEGDWEPSDMPQGVRKTVQGGLSLHVGEKEKKWDETLDITARHNDANDETLTTTERFASAGNIYGRSSGISRQRDFRLSVWNRFVLSKPFKLMAYIDGTYSNGKHDSQGLQTTFTADPAALGDTWAVMDSAYQTTAFAQKHLTNRNRTQSYNKYRSLSLMGSVHFLQKLAWGDDFSINVAANYRRSNPSDNFSMSLIEYLQTGQTDYRRQYTDSHSSHCDYAVTGTYTFHFLSGLNYSLYARYDHKWDDRVNELFNLETIDSARHNVELTLLPSSRSELLTALDMQNTKNYTLGENHFEEGMRVYYNPHMKKGWAYVSLSLPLHQRSQEMHFRGAQLDTIARRSLLSFSPSFTAMFSRDSLWAYANARVSVSDPDFASLMPVNNDANPLSVRLFNARLKSTQDYHFSASATFSRPSVGQNVSVEAGAGLVANAVGTRSVYNTATGAYAFRNENVSGNWEAYGRLGFNRALDAKKRWNMEEATNVGYNRNVDFDLEYATLAPVEAMNVSEARLSKVNNWNFRQTAGLKYTKDKWSVGVNGMFNWRHSTSSRKDFETINVFDFNYGVSFRCPLPLSLDLATDLKMFSIRGYSDRSLNTNHLVWNASLSRSFLSGRLTAKLDAYDLLKKLTSTSVTLNAQGRYETWHNCLPSYAMLHMIWKFNKMPK